MRKVLYLQLLTVGLSLLNGLLFSCSTELLPVDSPAYIDAGTIHYETDTGDPDEFTDLFPPGDLAGARLGATDSKGKLTFEYMSNEGEIITNQWERITLWYYGGTEPAPGANSRYQKPRSTVQHPANNRSYTRKSCLPGWYMIQLDDSETFYVVNVAPGSDGLFVINDQGGSGKPLFSGYYPAYGKIKFTFGSVKATKTKPAVSTKAQAFLTMAKDNLSLQFWLYNDRTTGAVTKNMFWFMPVGTYSASWYGVQIDGASKQSAVKTGTVVVASGKIYPNVIL